MTVQEAIEEMKICNELMLYDFSYGEEIPYESLNESNKKLFDAHVFAIEIMEKQIPKKPKKMEKDAINDLDTWVECSCGAMKKMDTEKHKQVYCWKCGQLLSWEEGGTSD